MYTTDIISKYFGVPEHFLQQYYQEGILASDQEFSKEDIFRIVCAKCLSESGASPAQIKMILNAIHPSRQLNVGVYTPRDGMLTVFFVPHAQTEQRRYALEQIWEMQSKNQVTVVINFEKILIEIEAALGAFEIKGA